MLHLERGPDRPLAVQTREGVLDKDGSEKVLQLLVDDVLHDLVPKLRDVEVALFRLCYFPIVVRARSVFLALRLWRFLNFPEIAPQADVVHFGQQIVVDGLAGVFPVTSERGLVALLDPVPSDRVLVYRGRHDRWNDRVLDLL